MASYSEFDVKSERNISPGGQSRVIRLLVAEEDAALMSELDEIERVRTKKLYQIKNIFLSGIGLAEVDIALAQAKPFVRTY